MARWGSNLLNTCLITPLETVWKKNPGGSEIESTDAENRCWHVAPHHQWRSSVLCCYPGNAGKSRTQNKSIFCGSGMLPGSPSDSDATEHVTESRAVSCRCGGAGNCGGYFRKHTRKNTWIKQGQKGRLAWLITYHIKMMLPKLFSAKREKINFYQIGMNIIVLNLIQFDKRSVTSHLDPIYCL